jgi:hypothetical protein
MISFFIYFGRFFINFLLIIESHFFNYLEAE